MINQLLITQSNLYIKKFELSGLNMNNTRSGEDLSILDTSK